MRFLNEEWEGCVEFVEWKLHWFIGISQAYDFSGFFRFQDFLQISLCRKLLLERREVATKERQK